MSQISREALEKSVSLDEAGDVVNSFCGDRVTYSSKDVHLKKGVCKVLLEEYFPLLRLAETLPGVRSVRLLPKANPGPDGEIKFWYSSPSKVQIICAYEDYSRRLMREQLAEGEIVFPNQRQDRDKLTGKAMGIGRILVAGHSPVQVRLERILRAIRIKEEKFYPGTDTLLVGEESAKFEHLKDLHRRVCEEVRRNGLSRYERIYVNYYNEVKRIS